MLRKYLKDVAFIQLLNLLVKPVWILVIDRAVQNQLDQAAYGEYFALFNFSLLFFIFLDLGVSSFNTTEVARDPKVLRRQFGDLFGLKIMLAFLYVFLIFLFGNMMGYRSEAFGLLLLIAGVQILTSFNQYFRSSISAMQLFRLDGIFMVLDRLLIIVLSAILIWGEVKGLRLNITNFVWAQLIGLGTVSILLVAYIYNRIHRVSLSFSLRHIFPMLRRTWPYGLLVMLMGAYNYIDGVMLEQLAPDRAKDAGDYAMGYRIYFALFMFAQVFSNVLLSMYSKHSKERSVLRKLSSFNGKLLLFGTLTAALLAFVNGQEIMAWLYPAKTNDPSVAAFVLLMFGLVGSGLILVYGTLLTSMRKLKALNWAALVTLLLNLILNYRFIPVHGAGGAAIATMVSQLLFGLACFAISWRQLGMNWSSGPALRLGGGVLLLFSTIVLGAQYLPGPYVHWAVIALSLYLILRWTGVLDRKALNS